MSNNNEDVQGNPSPKKQQDAAENPAGDQAGNAAVPDSANPTEGLPDKMPDEDGVLPMDLESVLEQVKAKAASASAEAGNGSAGAASASAVAAAAVSAAQSAASGEEEQAAEKSPEQQLLDLQSKVAELEAGHKDEMLRMQAEMQNQRKRLEVQADRSRKFALEGFAKELLEVKDSLEMGIDAAKVEGADINSFIEGSDLTLKKLAQTFEKHNIAEINPIDEKFDPEFHEAMSQQPIEGKEPNTVVGVIQKGYSLNGRVIRAARVMVAK